ncbi:MAG: DNA-processing protein DprA [Phycisphaerales bacterium]|nr:DNA-processing protein DprA [Phycisphaerales bacterium]
MLATIPNAPPILYVRGTLQHDQADRYPIAIVGSRSCSHYAVEQAERFGLHLGQAGLTIVSGGARGVDTAAHRGALRGKGRTIAVLGCGLAECYPPENADLFDRIAAGSGGAGCIVSELPLRTPPNAENFPARNRIISGLSLGVLVVEAGKKSGALITVRMAVEEHGREAFALPARVDSAHAEGSLELLKSGGAQLVTHPDDILQSLESPARHLHAGTHEARYAVQQPSEVADGTDPQAIKSPASVAPLFASAPPPPRDVGLNETQRQILAALDTARTIDDLGQRLNLDVAKLRTEITMLELKRRVTRRGSSIERRDA